MIEGAATSATIVSGEWTLATNTASDGFNEFKNNTKANLGEMLADGVLTAGEISAAMEGMSKKDAKSFQEMVDEFITGGDLAATSISGAFVLSSEVASDGFNEFKNNTTANLGEMLADGVLTAGEISAAMEGMTKSDAAAFGEMVQGFIAGGDLQAESAEETAARAVAAQEAAKAEILRIEGETFVRLAAFEAALALGADATREDRVAAARAAATETQDAWEVALLAVQDADDAAAVAMQDNARDTAGVHVSASKGSTAVIVADAGEVAKQFQGLSDEEAFQLGESLLALGSKANKSFTDIHNSAISAGNALANRLLPQINSVVSALGRITDVDATITIHERTISSTSTVASFAHGSGGFAISVAARRPCCMDLKR